MSRLMNEGVMMVKVCNLAMSTRWGQEKKSDDLATALPKGKGKKKGKAHKP